MIRNLLLLVSACLPGFFAANAIAQISFGVTQQNGVIGGGSLSVGGFVTNGGTGVRLGVSTNTTQLIGVQNFTFRNGGGVIGPANGGNMNRPTGQNQQVQFSPQAQANQFVQAAGRFDRDKSGTLDKNELKNVAVAVIVELKQQRPAAFQTKNSKIDGAVKPPTQEQMVEKFVDRSLSFDSNKDDALDAKEMNRMATAFLRTLG